MTLVTAAPAGWVKVIAVGEIDQLTRGRPAEFRHRGLTLAGRPTAGGALLEIGKDPTAIVLVPTTFAGMPLVEFVDVLRTVAHAAVIAGIAPGSSSKAVSELFDHGVASAVVLPATPGRLGEAVLATRAIPPVDDSILELDDLVLDNGRHRVTWQRREISLAPKCFAILRHLMLAYPRVVPLSELVREFEGGVGEGAIRIRVSIGRMRAAFADGVATPGVPFHRRTPVETVHRIGYRVRSWADEGPPRA